MSQKFGRAVKMRKFLTAVSILLLSFGLVWAQDPEGELDYYYVVCGVNGYAGSGVSEVCFKIRYHSDNTGSNIITGAGLPIIITGNNIVSVDTISARAWAGSAAYHWNIRIGPYKPEDPDPSVSPFHLTYGIAGIEGGEYLYGDSLFVNLYINVNDTGTICIDTMSTEFMSPSFTTASAISYLAGWAGPFCCKVDLCQAKAGDSNENGVVSIADAIFKINQVLKGGPAPSLFCQSDDNADGKINITDVIYSLTYIFKGGSAPVKRDLCCL